MGTPCNIKPENKMPKNSLQSDSAKRGVVLNPDCNKLKILFLIPYFIPAYRFGGPIRGTYETGLRLVKKGHEVTVYTTDAWEPKKRIDKKEDIINGMHIKYFPNINNLLASKYKIFSPVGMYSQVKKKINNFDIIHIQEYYTIITFIGGKLSKKYNKKYLVSIRGALSDVPMQSKNNLKKIFNFFLKKFLFSADAITVQTENERKDCRKHNLKNLRIIRNGIDTEMFKKIPPRSIFRKKYEIKPDENVLLFVGRINKIKGLKYLIEALSRLKDRKIRLFIIGPDDNYLGELKTYIDKFNLNNINIIKGLYGAEKLEALAGSDIFVLPSIYDCSPNSMLEACASGLPIITTTENGLHKIISDGAGILINSKDSKALSSAIIKLITDPQLMKKMGAKGSKIVFDKYSWNKVTDELEKLYFKMLGD